MTKTGEAARPPRNLDDHAESLLDWAKAHSRQVAIGAISVAALAATVFFWQAASEKKEANAGRALSDAQRAFASGNLPLAQSDLQKMVQRYDGTMAASQARLLLAQVLFEQNKVDDGLKQLDEVDAEGPFEASVHAIRAAGLEQAQKPAEAAAYYRRASDAARSDSEKAQFLADAARTYAAAGQKEQALEIWRKMAEDETNPLSAEAKLRVGELSAKPIS